MFSSYVSGLTGYIAGSLLSVRVDLYYGLSRGRCGAYYATYLAYRATRQILSRRFVGSYV